MPFPIIKPINKALSGFQSAKNNDRNKQFCHNARQRDRPYISVITVTYNRKKLLERCIRSVISQSYKDFELIIIDGGSNDGTLDLLREFNNKISYWSSGVDAGIGDAMNKGVDVALGQWIIFLHSDDFFLSSDGLMIASDVLNLSQESIVAFQLYGQDALGKRWPRSNHPWNWRMNFKTSLLHQATFCRHELFVKIGGFDTSLSIAMDYDWFLRAYRSGANAQLNNYFLSVMSNSGVSALKDKCTLSIRLGDERCIHFRNGSYLMKPFYYIYWFMYPIYKSLKLKKMIWPSGHS